MSHQLTLDGNPAPPQNVTKPPKQEAYNPKLSDLPESERPVNRLHHYGPTSLSNTELLAILIGTPYQLQDAQRLISALEGMHGLARASTGELSSYPGMGHTTSARLKAAFELSRRYAVEQPADLYQIRSPADAANLLMLQMAAYEQEHLVQLILDTKNRVQSQHTVYKGSLNTSLIRVGELFREPIRRAANAIIIAHNHPSGDPSPSPEDVSVTRQIVEAGKLLDIEVLDHLIIGRNRFISLKERGLGF